MTSTMPSVSELRALGAMHQPTYPRLDEVQDAVARLRGMPPLVFAGECDDLTGKLAAVAEGRAFVLQGGDCAETFADLSADNVRAKLRVLLQMAVVLTYAASVPVVKIGRMAGQYAKPRSSDTETRITADGDLTLPAFRGDAVNGYDFTAKARQADPARLVDAYNASAATLNLVRAFTAGGYASLREVHTWNRDFVQGSPLGERYESLASEIDSALGFMDAIGVAGSQTERVDFYSSHEALLLDYEHALTRQDSRTGLPYDVSAHFLWVGERTRQIDGAHIEFASRISNPIGVKLGPTTTPDDVLAYARRLNPDNRPGRLTFITRFGAASIGEGLPPLLQRAASEGLQVAWICDPMHGNGHTTATGYKTRRFDDVMTEVRGFFQAHREVGTWPGGLHVELTGDNVTECIGGGEELTSSDLSTRYESVCDPRLNRVQSLELAFLVADVLRQTR